ncbi:MAG: energy-coupling factor ABC transporter ATP-binding protein, partial [Filifactoraceae bacterium]
MSDIITFEGFSFQYAGSNKVALHDIDFNITKGEITVLVGASGSGKTTLLKCIKEEIAPVGLQSGSIIRQIPSSDICMVFQNPEVQLVCGSVRYDLVFHMENLGIPREVMKRRLAETCCYFGIEPLLHKKPEELSGGQKQLIALCAALMVQPTLLLLDEPLSQLDPLATLEFLDLLKRINQEFGVTILMSEHRLSDCIGIADTIAIMDKGEMVEFGETRRVLENIWKNKKEHLFMHIPEITRASLMLMDKPLLTPRELICSLKKDISYKWKPYKDKDL